MIVPALEARNGAMLRSQNELIERIVAEFVPSRGSRLGVVAGSDAHTLRRVGRTWTEAPGRSREEFLESLRRGLGRPMGNHGGATVISGDAYGVIGRYAASLAGWGPRDHHGWHRAACLVAVAASIPVQFFPLVVATAGKIAERRETGARTTRPGARVRRRPPSRRRRNARDPQGRHRRHRPHHVARVYPRGDLASDDGRGVRHRRSDGLRLRPLQMPAWRRGATLPLLTPG